MQTKERNLIRKNMSSLSLPQVSVEHSLPLKGVNHMFAASVHQGNHMITSRDSGTEQSISKGLPPHHPWGDICLSMTINSYTHIMLIKQITRAGQGHMGKHRY